MTGLVIEKFGGMLPRYGQELIPPNAASFAQNCRLLSGELQSLKAPAPVASFTAWSEVIQRAYRVQTQTGGFYAAFDEESIDFVKAPIDNDGFNRHYWTSEDDVPRYATEAMLSAAFLANDVPTGLRLGIPAPETELNIVVKDPDAPTTGASFEVRLAVTATMRGDLSAFGTAPANMSLETVMRSEATFEAALEAPEPVPEDTLDETRVYVYTFVSAYGEEGAPSPPKIMTGSSLDSWYLSDIATTVSHETERDIEKVNIYRTITGAFGNLSYYLVDTIEFGETEYVDTKSAEEIALNPILETMNWNEPPEEMIGLITHPNGFLLGFVGRDVYMSVPYRPHAWPTEFIISTRWNIVGLGIVGQSVVILTEGAPYVAGGVRPEAMTLVKSDTPDPCQCRRGIVSTHDGVFYPGIDGLMLAGPTGDVVNLTKKVLTRREWNLQCKPYALQAVKYDSQYVAFYDDTHGFAIDFEEQNQAFVWMIDDLWRHTSIQEDPASGRVWLLQDNQLKVWNPESGAPVKYIWRSKEFVVPDPTNFGAYKITFKDITATGIYDPVVRDQMRVFNQQRIGFPLNPFNWAPFNGVHVVPITMPATTPNPTLMIAGQHKQPWHESPLYLLTVPDTPPDLIFKIYANREEVPYHEQLIEDMEQYRPQTAFKAILWMFELEGTADVQNIKVASTPLELSSL